MIPSTGLYSGTLQWEPKRADLAINSWVAVAPDKQDSQWKAGIQFWVARIVGIDDVEDSVNVEWLEALSGGKTRDYVPFQGPVNSIPIKSIIVSGLHLESCFISHEPWFRLKTAPSTILAWVPTTTPCWMTLRSSPSVPSASAITTRCRMVTEETQFWKDYQAQHSQ